MFNVYQQIKLFYEKRPSASSVYKLNKMERFFRERAWAGESDESQKQYWSVISLLFDYLCRKSARSFLDLNSFDIQTVCFVYADNHPDFKLTESDINDFHNILEDFSYYFDQDIIDSDISLNEIIEESREGYYVNSQFTVPDRETTATQANCINKLWEMEDNDLLNDLLNVTLAKMGVFFQSNHYRRDLEKAVIHFVGPAFEPEFNESFFATFWDYFFFDYHLTSDGLTPIKHFYKLFKSKLTTNEHQLFLTMQDAAFTVFTIKGVMEDMIFCQNLLTDEEFELPYPETDLGDYSKLVFYGHMQLNDVLLLNYITASPASPLLCKRIRSEILNLYELYRKYQAPKATIDDFLAKHAAAVRHTIYLLSTFTKVKLLKENIELPQPINCPENLIAEQTMIELDSAAEKLFFSAETSKLAKQMVNDYLSIDRDFDQENNYPLLVAASLYLFSTLNQIENNKILAGIYRHLKMKKNDAVQSASQMSEVLNCIKFDPRYLTTEGFVNFLFDEM